MSISLQIIEMTRKNVETPSQRQNVKIKKTTSVKDKVLIFTVQSLILNKYSPGLLNCLELY